ncbi:TonB-dependent receptor [Sphingosinicella microcystinivorans]|uniref:TonB-dependent receptor n=1 Tax=Sphingosinicella microcystinivorans TaxID=335406 RepID=UPI0022F3EC96|nr:TonB-dependent receptor [Sphingosinicella microcystinivorans]WBX83832.1 TonB-dependent receptor [Sphingosinicella microcystinivorans]
MRNPAQRRRALLASLAAGTMLISGTAYSGLALAQDANAQDSFADEAAQDIVVTARKREEKLQEAPLAISVMSAAQIENLGASRVSDLAARLPNVAALDQPAGIGGFGFSPYVRGIYTGARSIGFDSGFGVFINGAYGGRNEAANKFLPDLERVEFLPGPQATLFGKNTTIGVINMVTRKPGSTWEGDATIEVGNRGIREYGVRARGPLSDVLGIAISAGRREYGGYYRNVIPVERKMFDPDGRFDGRKGPKFNSTGGAIELVSDLERTTIDFLVDYTRANRHNDIYVGRVEGFDALPIDVRESATMPSQGNEDYGGLLSITQDFDAGALTLVTSHRKFTNDVAFDGDGYALPVQEGPEWATEQTLTSQEIRFAGEVGQLSYIVGGYWQDQSSRSARIADILGLASVRVAGKIKARTFSAFTNLDYKLSDRLSAEVGVRWENERKRLSSFTQNGGALLGVIDIDQDPLSRSVSHVSYTGSVAYSPIDRVHTHLRYSKGYKSGGYNIDFVTAPVLTPLEFGDESADNYEVGLKVQLTDRLFLNSVYYRTDYHDLQQSEYTRVPGQPLPVITTKNSGEARTEGIEVSATYRGERLNVNAALGTANARYTDWLRQTATGFSDETGKKLPAPDFTFNILGDYRLPVGDGNLHFIAEYIYRSRAPQPVTMPSGPILPDDPTSPLRPSYHVDAISVVNLRLRYEISPSWSVTGWVRNVFDERAVIMRQPNDAEGFFEAFGIFPASSIRTQVVGEHQAPRHFGAMLQYRF